MKTVQKLKMIEFIFESFSYSINTLEGSISELKNSMLFNERLNVIEVSTIGRFFVHL